MNENELLNDLKNPRMCEAKNLIEDAQQWVKDPDLQNRIDAFFGRQPSNKPATIIFNDNPVVMPLCVPFVANVRALLAPEQHTYALIRENKGGRPDQHLTDAMRVFDGDVIYSVPPCHGA